MSKIIPIISEPQQKVPPSLSTWRIWLAFLRLPSLQLSLVGVNFGNFWASKIGVFSWSVLWLSLLTAISLQLLANLADDYGDATHHSGDKRVHALLAQNKVSTQQLFWAICAMTAFSVLSGLALIFVSPLSSVAVLLILGALAIVAAITYTIGKKPYGYYGFGDISVLLFFGFLSVLGSFYTQTGTFQAALLLPAFAIGLWCVAVLNINNMRDIGSDLLVNKRTLAAQLGMYRARIYHLILLLLALLAWSVFVWQQYHWESALLALGFTIANIHILHLSMRQKELFNNALQFMTFSVSGIVICFLLTP